MCRAAAVEANQDFIARARCEHRELLATAAEQGKLSFGAMALLDDFAEEKGKSASQVYDVDEDGVVVLE